MEDRAQTITWNIPRRDCSELNPEIFSFIDYVWNAGLLDKWERCMVSFCLLQSILGNP